jgi:hypothetical protein
MRRIASIGFILALSGCGMTDNLPSASLGNPAEDYIGSPVSGMGSLFADTHTPFRNPNRPVSDAQNVKRLTGQAVVADALLPDTGNVWPGPFKPAPSLSDVAKTMDAASAPAKPAKTP